MSPKPKLCRQCQSHPILLEGVCEHCYADTLASRLKPRGSQQQKFRQSSRGLKTAPRRTASYALKAVRRKR